MEPACHVLEGGLVVGVRFIANGIPVELEDVTERVRKPESAAMPLVTLNPTDGSVITGLDSLNTPCQCSLGRHPVANVPNTRGVMARQLETMKLVILPSPQIRTVTVESA